jgi:hypothetical protein
MAWALLFASPTSAGLITLIDEGSIARIDTQSQSGFYDWEIDGVDHMFQEWFWIGVGNNAEQSIDIGWVSDTVTDADGDGDLDTVNSVFLVAGSWEVDLRLSLLGTAPGNGIADMLEQVRVVNLGQTRQTFRLYEYTDFDLNNNVIDDVGIRENANNMVQVGESTRAEVSHTGHDRWEIDAYANILNKLNDGVADTLPNATSPFGPADITFALQWNRTLNPGQSFVISKDKLIYPIPEPSSVVLLGLGGVVMGVMGLRRRRSV